MMTWWGQNQGINHKKNRSYHDDNFIGTGGAGGCCFDNLQGIQWQLVSDKIGTQFGM